jgi:pyruvate dehydrogenase E2 component (dihydrolipoamide acetyltransferase)
LAEAPSAPAAAEAAAPPPAPAAAPRHDPIPVLDESANATPLARRIAAIRDIALSGVTGTGPDGRIVKADLGPPSIIAPAAAPMAITTAAAPAAAVLALPPASVPAETVKLSSMRKTIARRLSEAKQTVPHFYLTARCNLDPLLKLRAENSTPAWAHAASSSASTTC